MSTELEGTEGNYLITPLHSYTVQATPAFTFLLDE